MSRSRKPLLQPPRLPHGELGDRRNAAKELVMVRNLLDSFRRNAPAVEDTLEERPHIGRALRPAERDNQNSVKCHRAVSR
jgi:hypothetical protein